MTHPDWGTPYFPPMAGDLAQEIMKQGGETLNRIQKETLINNLITRLEAAGHDEPLAPFILKLQLCCAPSPKWPRSHDYEG